jgi:hypothetical protein
MEWFRFVALSTDLRQVKSVSQNVLDRIRKTLEVSPRVLHPNDLLHPFDVTPMMSRTRNEVNLGFG